MFDTPTPALHPLPASGRLDLSRRALQERRMKLRVAAVAVSGAFGECAYAQPVTISPGSCLQVN